MTVDVIVAARRRTRRRVLIVVGVAVGVLVLLVYPAGLYVNSRLEASATDPSPSAPAAVVPWPAGGGVVVYPADLAWTTVAGIALPTSATAGPRQTQDGLAAGFSHTPAGAVLAAVHLLVRTSPQVGPAVFGPPLRDQVVGTDADAMRAVVAEDYRQLAGDTATGPVGQLSATLAGAALASYTDQAAQLDLLTAAVDATGTARYAATSIAMAWTGTDWALVAPPQGRWDTSVRPVTAQQATAYPPLTQGR